MARRYLDEARGAERAGLGRDVVACARACIENALKAVIARREPPPRTHDPHVVLQRFLDAGGKLPDLERPQVAELVRIGQAYGLVEHLRFAYGDEDRGLTPWDLATPERIARSLADAGEVLRIATALVGGPGV